jgi:hypothetical protein
MSYGTVQAEKMTTESGYSLGAGNASSFKNRVINGEMDISQRNGTTAVVCADVASTYGVDRFSVYKSNASATVTIGQSATAPTGFVNSSIFSVTTGSAPSAANECQFRHTIEGFNVSDLAFGTASAKTVTVSFWVRSSLTGTFAVAFQNSGSGLSYVSTYVISSANTWEQKTVTFTGPSTGTWLTNNGSGIVCIWDLGGGSNFNATTNTWTAGNVYTTSGTTKVIGTTGATWQITGVQFEVGTVATSFDFRSIGTELALCQRYYWKSTGDTVAVAAGVFVTSTVANIYVKYPQAMRAAPTFNQSSTWVNNGASSSNVSAISATYANINSALVQPLFSGSAGAAQGATWLINTTGFVDATAEL